MVVLGVHPWPVHRVGKVIPPECCVPGGAGNSGLAWLMSCFQQQPNQHIHTGAAGYRSGEPAWTEAIQGQMIKIIARWLPVLILSEYFSQKEMRNRNCGWTEVYKKKGNLPDNKICSLKKKVNPKLLNEHPAIFISHSQTLGSPCLPCSHLPSSYCDQLHTKSFCSAWMISSSRRENEMSLLLPLSGVCSLEQTACMLSVK